MGPGGRNGVTVSNLGATNGQHSLAHEQLRLFYLTLSLGSKLIKDRHSSGVVSMTPIPPH